ncbi:MAG: O-antigen ligase family protein [Candidatus Omnitrophica bacterium]|nr:O-antigen ligase family protein [Candidatus Omnitrophota bacterium]
MDLLILFFMLLIGLVIIFLIIRNPFIGLYVFTVLLYLRPGIFHPALSSVHLTRLIALVTFILLFFHQEIKEKIVLFEHHLSKLLLFFFGMMCLSVTTSIWISNAVEVVGDFLKVILAYFLIINLATTVRKCRILVWAMILSMVFIVVMSLKDYDGGRLFGSFRGALFGDPNDLSLGLIMLIPFLFYGIFVKKGFVRKIVHIAVMGLFLGAFVLTKSRGGLFGIAGMFFAFWLISKQKIVTALAVAIVILVGWNMAPQDYKDRMMSIQAASVDDAAAISRLDAWKAGLNMMKDRVFGVGVGNFGEAFVIYRPEGAIDVPGMRRASHNMFVQVGGEMGIPGLIVFLILIFSTFKTFNKVSKAAQEMKDTNPAVREIELFAKANIVGLCGYCASGIFLSQAYNWVLYYLVAFAVLLDQFLSHLTIDQSALRTKK